MTITADEPIDVGDTVELAHTFADDEVDPDAVSLVIRAPDGAQSTIEATEEEDEPFTHEDDSPTFAYSLVVDQHGWWDCEWRAPGEAEPERFYVRRSRVDDPYNEAEGS